MKQVIDSSHIMLTTLNILGARLLLACSHSLASLQCVSSDLRLTCCSILSLISHATITFFGTFVQASSKQDADEVSRLSRLQSLLSIALFVKCFFTLSLLLHNLICMQLVGQLTHRRKMIRTIFHCTAQLRLQVDSTDQKHCTGQTITSLCDAQPAWSALSRFTGQAHLRCLLVRLPRHFRHRSEVISKHFKIRAFIFEFTAAFHVHLLTWSHLFFSTTHLATMLSCVY